MLRMLTAAMMAGLVLGLAGDGYSARSARGGRGEPRILETADGRFVRGWLNKGSGGELTFTDMDGATMEITKSSKLHTIRAMEAEYQQVQRSILTQDLKDYEKYTKLMDWARQHGLYKQVAENAERVIRLNPSNPDPTAVKELAWAREQLAAVKTGPSSRNQSNWTMEDVQKVRFALLPTKRPVGNVQVSFKRKVQQRFLEEMAARDKYRTPEAKRQFLAKPPAEQARIIKLETGNMFQPDIVIANNPPVMAEFQRVIQPILTRTCATTLCHGSGTLSLKLLPRATAAPEIYANYFALDTHRAKGGDLIDHGKAENSLLLQFLLPASEASAEGRHPQPITPPPVRTTKDVRYQQVLKWIKSLPPEPIDVAISGDENPTSQPSNDVRSDSDQGAEQKGTVYCTPTGRRYHTAGCRFVGDTAGRISLAEAKGKGLTPCEVCKAAAE